VHLNDIASFDFPGFSPADYAQQLTGASRGVLGSGALHSGIVRICRAVGGSADQDPGGVLWVTAA
jgi:hypothetical protein